MSRHSIQLVIVLATLSIVGITITQIFWVRRAFDFREKEYDQKVMLALGSVSKSILSYNNRPYTLAEPVKQLSSSYFVVMVNDVIDEQLLELLLRHEFNNRGIDTDFDYAIYDCVSKEMVRGKYINSNPESRLTQEASVALPSWNKDNYYFGVCLLNKDLAIIGRMGFWSFSSGVLLLVIGFFGYTSFVLLKQKRLSEVQRDFINNMTHEFKTPISTIAISSDVLKNPAIVQSPERLLHYATIIGEEAGRLKNQVERVLQMATIDMQEVSLRKEPVDVHRVIEQAVQHLELALQQKCGKISYHLEATQATILADRLHLTNMIYNLLDNAIKYSSAAPCIHIATHTCHSHICISIRDNGLGIGPEEQKKVFDKFYRVPTGNVHDVKGFGLGLNYVKLMAKAHGGKVSLESNLNSGSTFSVFLSLA
jgi:two-component system phosphate regulon sensor histidine kinase PhoR